jgi:beta-N-acetylhexosaminidase
METLLSWVRYDRITPLVRVVELAVALILLYLAIHFRAPWLVTVRAWLFWTILALSFAILAREFRQFTKQFLAFWIVLIAIATLFITVSAQAKHLWLKQQIFQTNAEQLERLGQHFIVGYQDLNEVKQLVEKRAIAGIFLSTRNIENKTKSQIKQEIETLQNIRQDQNLPPLWIATDQEGGIVSRLSPPLALQPQLSEVIQNEETNPESQRLKVLEYGRSQGKALSELGVNLNFAPVVDLNKGVVNPKDKFSQIYKRAISSDQQVVSRVAFWYCLALKEFQVNCTLKHFPGLGRVHEDTHVDQATLATPIDQLVKEDWVPFQELMQTTPAFVMLSHAKLSALDKNFPTSFSRNVVDNLIRKQWNYQGILVTDDFSMKGAYGDEDGVEWAVVRSLNAGVDLILVSFDNELYYELMNAALKGYQTFQIQHEKLQQSRTRLQQFLPKFS